ncbi:hypothetical protein [Streptomyces lanatus]|uniref:Lipoprotein n=1 Tax=Streptomyces lanatus TaxID=66900 RepID=A0ABV1XJI8_9ACTN|nr:hypothetical protein [Streptomyces lanatus]GHG90816.1 hypothetical protein GCM10018780_10830 [Streptomyces lanatus]
MTPHRAASPRLLAAALMALLLTTGCSTGESTDAGPTAPKQTAPKPTAEVLGLVLPFDAYEISHQESFTVAKARDLLMRNCMRRRGHEWKTLDYPAHVDDLRNRRRYGVIEIEVARNFGYHATPEILSAADDVTDRRKERDEHLGSDAVRAAYDEKNGCGYQANDFLERDGGSADYDRFNELSSKLLTEAKKQPEVVGTLRDWQSCMRKKGFTYRTPDDAIADRRWWTEKSDTGKSDTGKSEIATAVADVQCKEQTSLVKTLYTAESRLQRQAVARERSYFDGLAAAKARNLRNARDVIDGR